MFLSSTKSVEVSQEAPRQANAYYAPKEWNSIFGEKSFYRQAAAWENCGSWAVSPMSKLGNDRIL